MEVSKCVHRALLQYPYNPVVRRDGEVGERIWWVEIPSASLIIEYIFLGGNAYWRVKSIAYFLIVWHSLSQLLDHRLINRLAQESWRQLLDQRLINRLSQESWQQILDQRLTNSLAPELQTDLRSEANQQPGTRELQTDLRSEANQQTGTIDLQTDLR